MTDSAVETAAASALELIRDGMRVGLGTGHSAAAFLARLADRVRSGLRVVGVPTSEATAAEARSLGIPLGALDDDEDLALTVDGADEVAPNLDLVKGFGGALVRERIVAAASRRQVILVGHDKLVDRLATRGRIPIEVVPFACGLVLRRVRALGLDPVVRLADGRRFCCGKRRVGARNRVRQGRYARRALDPALQCRHSVGGGRGGQCRGERRRDGHAGWRRWHDDR